MDLDEYIPEHIDNHTDLLPINHNHSDLIQLQPNDLMEIDDLPKERIKFENRESAFTYRLQSFAIINLEHIDLKQFLTEAFTIFSEKIKEIVDFQYIIKVGAYLKANFIKNEEVKLLYCACRYEIIDIDTVEGNNLTDWYKTNIVDRVLKKVEEFEIEGSGWTFHSIIELKVDCNQYDVLGGGTYIPLPKILSDKKAIINVLNVDNKCFMWAVLSALYEPNNNAQKVAKYYRFQNELNFTGIEFPVELKNIQKFEQLNPKISINVYMFDKKKQRVYSVRLTKTKKEHHIHLLLLSEIDCDDGVDNIYNAETVSDSVKRTHYCWIKNFERLVRSQITKSKNAIQICDRCLQHFTSESLLNVHKPYCMEQNSCNIEMPNKDKGEHIIQFKNYQNKLAVPFIIYADLESILMKPTRKFGNSDSTTAYQEHAAYCIGYYLHCNFDHTKSYYKSNRGEACIEWFVSELHRIACEIGPILRTNIPMKMTSEDNTAFENSLICHICDKALLVDKVRDHCHLTGKYRGAAHTNCNVLYESSKTIPVIFHNLSGYDSHFFIRELNKTNPRE